MEIKEAYTAFGGDYDDVMGRLMKEDRVEKYLNMFLQDTVMKDLESSYATEDFDTMFRAAHTLKGNTLTLGLTALHDSSVVLTEALRAGDHSDLDAQLAAVKADYQRIIDAMGQ